MRKSRTAHPPLFDASRPQGPSWDWSITTRVASSGYPTFCHVIAHRGAGDDQLVGTAACEVALGDDLMEVWECLAVESMMAACEPQLTGEPTHRRVVFSSNL